MTDKLTVEEALDLSKLEKVIAKWQHVFVEVGNALLEIRDRRLYRKAYGSFNEYCEAKWGWGERRASQLIQAAIVVQQLPASHSTMVPSERVARAVAKVPKERRAEVVEAAAQATNGHVTAQAVEVAAKSVATKAKLVDSLDREIPVLVQKYWERIPEIKELCIQLVSVKNCIEKAFEDKDLMYAELSATAMADLDNALHALKSIIPYAVCPTCQGHPEIQPRGECRLCLSRGLVSKFRWRTVPEETRAMIEKGATKK